MTYRDWLRTSSRILAGAMALLVILIGTFIGRGYELTYVLGAAVFIMLASLVVMMVTQPVRGAKV